MLINVARGGVYDEAAVAQALTDGKIAGAAFDVYDPEPPVDSPLLTAPNTVLTPHLGALTAEAQLRVAEEACEQVIDVLAGRSARYAVNAPLLTPETSRAIAPYLPLTVILGRFAAQYLRGGVKTLTIDVAGDLADHDASQLTAAALRGILENATSERVNLINAGFLAKNRGLTVNERKTNDAGTFASLVTLTVEGDTGKAVVAGTVANGEPRLVRIDDSWLDMAPAPLMVVTRHQDKPGTMGRIGLILGEADVNISSMTLARTAPAPGRADAPRRRRRGPGRGRRADPEPPCRPRRVGHPGRHGTLKSSLRDAERPQAGKPGLRGRSADSCRPRRRPGPAPPRPDPVHRREALPGRDGGAAHRPRRASRRAWPAAAWRPRAPIRRCPSPTLAPFAIVHSPLGRARRSAELAVEEMAAAGRATPPLRADAGFSEIGQGDWEGLTDAEITARFGDSLAGWRRWPTKFHAPGGETLEQVSRPASTAALSTLLAEMADGIGTRHP